MMLRRLRLALMSLFACGGYVDTTTPAGIPNLHPFPGVGDMYRTGYPPTEAAWEELRKLVARGDRKVVRVVLHDMAEGDESPARNFGWDVLWYPMPPEEDQPLTVFVKPTRDEVDGAVQAIMRAHANGAIVVFGCMHGRDRTGLVAGLLGMRMLGWSKEEAWKYALATGMRWELPDIDAFWVEDVP